MRNASLRYAAVALLLALSLGCRDASAPQTTTTTTTSAPASAFVPDPHSFARPDEARVTHVALDLAPDFATRRLRGTARLTIERAPAASSLVLDARDLKVTQVTDPAGAALKFELGASKPFMGQPLTIALPPSGPSTSLRAGTITIAYETSPDAAAVQWLSPAQTAGKRQPFLFTQGQAILTRTWVPTQDSPGIRQTYDAAIHVPAGMRAVMSAEQVSQPEQDADGRQVFRFRLDKPIPPYLIALAVGDIAFKEIGPRTGVFAEPPIVARAANEFAEVEQMIAAAERLYGPYRWGRYDLLVLPPSFPYGGMENPRVTFATPTILAGDRSLVSLVAHELAHSWSGNLVTNATWNDFWLNEGFTTYIERRIMEELRGRAYAEMLLQIGRQDLEAAIADVGGPQSPDTRLRLDLAGRDPDEGTSDIAYEKGSAFLQTVESIVGRERLDRFLREYFDRFAFQPMTSEHLIAQLDQRLFQGDEAKRVNVRAWIFEPGVPANVPPVHAAAFDRVDQQVDAWKADVPAAKLATKGWSTHEWVHFLRGLPKNMPAPDLADLDRAFKFSASGNSEILFEWLLTAIRYRYAPAFPALERFLTSHGRRKFLRPLYQELAKTDWGRKMADEIYARARPTYHSVSVSAVDAILKR